MFDFSGKKVLVTGASRGIGAAIADQMASLGADVTGTATTEDGAAAIQARLAGVCKQAGKGSGVGVRMDVNSPESCADVVAQVGTVDILVNNAAVTRDTLALRMKDADFEEVIATNLISVARVSRLVLKGMMKNRWGRIISISSVVGFTGNAGQTNYAAAKAGIAGYSKSLAREVASRNITVNMVAPGFIDTDMTLGLSDDIKAGLLAQIPQNRLGTPLDVAAAVAYLASEQASYVTGQTLHVNGGMLMP